MTISFDEYYVKIYNCFDFIINYDVFINDNGNVYSYNVENYDANIIDYTKVFMRILHTSSADEKEQKEIAQKFYDTFVNEEIETKEDIRIVKRTLRI